MHTQREKDRQTTVKSSQRNLTEEEKPRSRAVRVQKLPSCLTPSIIKQEKRTRKIISDLFEVTVSLSVTCWHVGQFRERDREGQRDNEQQRKNWDIYHMVCMTRAGEFSITWDTKPISGCKGLCDYDHNMFCFYFYFLGLPKALFIFSFLNFFIIYLFLLYSTILVLKNPIYIQVF